MGVVYTHVKGSFIKERMEALGITSTLTSIGMIPQGSGHMLNVHGGMAIDLHLQKSAHYKQVWEDGKLNLIEVKDGC